MENIVHVNYSRYAHWFPVIILKCVINNSFSPCHFSCTCAVGVNDAVSLRMMAACFIIRSHFALTPTYLSFMSCRQWPYCVNGSISLNTDQEWAFSSLCSVWKVLFSALLWGKTANRQLLSKGSDLFSCLKLYLPNFFLHQTLKKITLELL